MKIIEYERERIRIYEEPLLSSRILQAKMPEHPYAKKLRIQRQQDLIKKKIQMLKEKKK